MLQRSRPAASDLGGVVICPTPALPKSQKDLGRVSRSDEWGDEELTQYLLSQGYKVIRFWNGDVMNNIEGVILTIKHTLEESS